MNWKSIIGGAIAGLFAAMAVDFNAWSKQTEPYDWKLAFKRWVAGAITGASAGQVAGYMPD